MINQIKTIGIIGGGQLGKMLILEAKRLGFKVVTLDPSPVCPCASISDKLIVKGFSDKEGFLELAKESDVITYEFEHIAVALLEMLEAQGANIFPSVQSLKIIQDKLWQKQALQKAKIAVPLFEEVKDLADIESYYNRHQKPFFLKARRGGYDGKGNYFVQDLADCAVGFEKLGGGKIDLMAEEAVDFEKEISVIASRGKDGKMVVYPIAENAHKNSILDITKVPAAVDKKQVPKVLDFARAVLECFEGVGTFCVELFYNSKTGKILVNEVAPRVHNTGHYTIEATRVNQFENHIRAIVGLWLGCTDLVVGAAIMKNVIGDSNGKAKFVGIEKAYDICNTISAHDYGKETVAEGRKMGHYTITGKDIKEVEKVLGKIDIKIINN